MTMKKLAALVLTATVGCSASLDDIRRAQSNPEYCHQDPTRRELPRDGHLVFDEMQAHRVQRTEVTLLGGPPFARVPRARAVIRPSLAAAANYDSSRCDLTGPVAADGSRRLNMSFDIPAFVPPDGQANDTMGGPYVLQFWSDNDNNGRLSSEIGHLETADHLWVRPMCDDGAVYFVHASGLDAPEGLANAERLRQGRFHFDINQGAITQLEADMPAGHGDLISVAPMVVEANWQGQTVAYVRTVLRCDNDGVDDGVSNFELRNVIDPGSAHAIRTYWDIGRDGSYTEGCDPYCEKSQEAEAAGLLVTMDGMLAGWRCTMPSALAIDACMIAADR